MRIISGKTGTLNPEGNQCLVDLQSDKKIPVLRIPPAKEIPTLRTAADKMLLRRRPQAYNTSPENSTSHDAPDPEYITKKIPALWITSNSIEVDLSDEETSLESSQR